MPITPCLHTPQGSDTLSGPLPTGRPSFPHHTLCQVTIFPCPGLTTPWCSVLTSGGQGPSLRRWSQLWSPWCRAEPGRVAVRCLEAPSLPSRPGGVLAGTSIRLHVKEGVQGKLSEKGQIEGQCSVGRGSPWAHQCLEEGGLCLEWWVDRASLPSLLPLPDAEPSLNIPRAGPSWPPDRPQPWWAGCPPGHSPTAVPDSFVAFSPHLEVTNSHLFQEALPDAGTVHPS